MSEILSCAPIGHFLSHQSEKYMASKQASLSTSAGGKVILATGFDFEQALEDLIGFERIWLIYWFNRNAGWKPKVQTPRGGPKRGVFATRSPHRPAPIGISCVELLAIKGRELSIGSNDLLDGTPILDIKPYLPYADAFPSSKEGWTAETASQKQHNVHWSELARSQAEYIELNTAIKLAETVELRLKENPFPFPNHRIRQIDDNSYELAFKTWRILYSIQDSTITIDSIASGYDQATLNGEKSSRWDDVPFHIEFVGKVTGYSGG